MYSDEVASKDDERTSNKADLFMQEFKRFKNDAKLRDEAGLLAEGSVVHLQGLTEADLDVHQLKARSCGVGVLDLADCGECLRPPSEWSVYEFADAAYQGLYLVANPFRAGFQRHFIRKCLGAYHDLPNKTNLDLHTRRSGENLWDAAVKKGDFGEFNKLRWTTIGYHYDWTEKIYRKEDRNEVPADVADLTRLVARGLSFDRFEPEAGIINYYHLNSTLSAHTDHSEENMSAPLISISFGSSAVFLIGTETKSERPKAILLKSGDICVMSGRSRLAYHGVPRILKNDQLASYFTHSTGDESSRFHVPDAAWQPYQDYIAINRINLNIRQVYFS